MSEDTRAVILDLCNALLEVYPDIDEPQAHSNVLEAKFPGAMERMARVREALNKARAILNKQ